MTARSTRRQFLQRTAAAGAIACGYYVNPARAQDSKSPSGKLNLGIVGCGNKGWHNVEQLRSQNIVALCDVDTNFLDKAAQIFPNATQHRDYRRMLEQEAPRLDAVVVSTADHTHAPAASIALDLGKHVYCEKPLAHTVQEARALADLAARKKVATQMGTQIHAGSNYRRVVEVIQSGAIGPVREVYNWCNKGWSDGRFAVTDQRPPETLNWDLWLGPARVRPYSPNVHPANWRRFWEYGSGTFGDMACHVMDLPFWALNLRHPTAVSAEGPEVHPDGAPNWCKAAYEFPARGELPAVKFYWSDGGAHHEIVKNTTDHSDKPLATWGLGVLFVGDRGMLAADYGRYQLLPKSGSDGFQPPPKSIPDSVGHWQEWVQACQTGSPTTCNFDYSGTLTETVLLGIVAYRAGKRLEWDAEHLKATNASEAEQYLKKQYRKGFEVVGIS